MTRWNTSKVASYARAAGWAGDELARAVGVAMAQSGGDDHHLSNPSYVPALERRGLWGLRQTEARGFDFGALFDPATCAKAAHRAWDDLGRSWAWHPAYVSGAADDHIEVVRAVLSGALKEPADPTGATFAGMLDYRSRFAKAMSEQRGPSGA